MSYFIKMKIAHQYAKHEEFGVRVKKLVNLFEHLDKDKSGTLDKNEILEFYNQMNTQPMDKDHVWIFCFQF